MELALKTAKSSQETSAKKISDLETLLSDAKVRQEEQEKKIAELEATLKTASDYPAKTVNESIIREKKEKSLTLLNEGLVVGGVTSFFGGMPLGHAIR